MSTDTDSKLKKTKSCVPISILKERLKRKITLDKKIIAERQSLDSLFSLNSNIYDLLDPPEHNPSYDARKICHLSEKVTKNLLRLQDSTEGNLLRNRLDEYVEKKHRVRAKNKRNRENENNKKVKEEKVSKNGNPIVRYNLTKKNYYTLWSDLFKITEENFSAIFDFLCKGVLFLLMMLYVTNHLPCATCNACNDFN